MASAPRPGVGNRKEATEVAKQVLVIEYDGEEHRIAWMNVPVLEQVAVRKATGMPLSAFTLQFADDGALIVGVDTFCVLVWLARRAAGERALSFEAVAEAWEDSKLGTVKVDDGKGDDPEA